MIRRANPQVMVVALELIRQGVIEVRPDGSVWKLRNLGHVPLAAPKRAEQRSSAGYLMVHLNYGGKQYLVSAHRLVWTVLRGSIPDGLEPNHKDGDKHNNHPKNLELVTRGKNHEHAYATGLRERTNVPARIRENAIALRSIGMSYSRIADELGVSQTTAFRAVKECA